MVSPNEKEATVLAEIDSPNPLTLSTTNANIVDASDSVRLEKPGGGIADDQYPHGMKLVLLAGSSLVSVFMISLDQVSTPSSNVGNVMATTDTKGV